MRIGMRRGLVGWVAVGAGVVAGARVARGEVTRVATFENFSEGQSWSPAFTDPGSGIHFRDSTHPGHGFDVDYSSTAFGGGNFLTAGGLVPGPGSFLGASFGFTADLPEAARRVGLDVIYDMPLTGATLTAYDAVGGVVAQQVVPAGAADPLHLEVADPMGRYDIVRFEIALASGTDTGYDNVSYTVVPEPGVVLGVAVVGGVGAARRRRGAGRSARPVSAAGE